MTTKLTAAERETMERILRHGGKVTLTMGRLAARDAVRIHTVRRLEARGLVRYWAGRAPSVPSGQRVDLAVTAAGCEAIDEARGAEALAAEVAS